MLNSYTFVKVRVKSQQQIGYNANWHFVQGQWPIYVFGLINNLLSNLANYVWWAKPMSLINELKMRAKLGFNGSLTSWAWSFKTQLGLFTLLIMSFFYIVLSLLFLFQEISGVKHVICDFLNKSYFILESHNFVFYILVWCICVSGVLFHFVW